MTAKPVEWVLVVYYGPAAHQATYGRRVREGGYTKDYIQLSRREDFLKAVSSIFSVSASATGTVPLTYKWPNATAPGAFVFKSADRPHLKWETNLGAPRAWKMTLAPSDATPETIPGDPSHLDFESAEREFALLGERGAGQPYLMAIKLREEPRTLHLRAYLKDPDDEFAWADIEMVPHEIQVLAEKTSQRSALAWSLFQSGGTLPGVELQEVLSQLASGDHNASVVDALDAETGRGLANYLEHPAYGLFFDQMLNHDAWVRPAPLEIALASTVESLLQTLDARFPKDTQGDATAETLETDVEQVEAFREKIEQKSYAVPDSTATTKTRGSAQKAFSDAVKANYGYRCAITGIATRDFLIGSHIVPWTKDQSIRLDPSNGICLSPIVDRAFERGYLQIEDDLTIRIDYDRLGDDETLRAYFELYDGVKMRPPVKEAPRPEYLQRRRELIASSD